MPRSISDFSSQPTRWLLEVNHQEHTHTYSVGVASFVLRMCAEMTSINKQSQLAAAHIHSIVAIFHTHSPVLCTSKSIFWTLRNVCVGTALPGFAPVLQKSPSCSLTSLHGKDN
jgi:hypothetical protein